MLRYIVDAIAEGIARLECDDGSLSQVPLAALPQGTREGSVLILQGTIFLLDEDSTKQRAQDAQSRLNRLFEKNG
ncbi:DUF3006 domain-containing protein [Eubacteriales bacterium OttesenSCG-928-N14]|nr:DUF3006 domain-containing protein [Eubacteriales bacterium OttesenSCG-928-N14]